MSWEDRQHPRPNQLSKLALPAIIFGAAILVFCFGLFAPSIFSGPQESKPKQIAKAKITENTGTENASAEKSTLLPASNPFDENVATAPPSVSEPQSTAASQANPPANTDREPPATDSLNATAPTPPVKQPSTTPSGTSAATTPPASANSQPEPKYNESEADVVTIRVRPELTPTTPNSPRTSATPPYQSTFRPTPAPTPNPNPAFTPNPAPFAPTPTTLTPTTPTPNPQFTRPQPPQITEVKPEWKSKYPAVKLPDQDTKEEVTLHKLPESSSPDPADKQQFSLDVSAAAVPKGMTLVVQKQMEEKEPVWQVSLEPAPKAEAEAKPATHDEAQPSAAPEAQALISQPVGAFRVINGELRYRWLGSTPEAAQVANCVANVRWNGKDEKILLRKAERTQNLSLSLSKLPPNFPTGAEIPPKAESIQFVLVELAGFDETVDIEPDNGIARITSRVKVRPNHALNVEFDLGIIVRSDGLAIQPKPTFLLTENNRQEFSTEKLQSVMTLTNNRIQKDIGRLQFAQGRLRDIPGEISRLSSVNAQAAVKAAALTALQREAKSSDSTVRSLTVSIPKSQEVLQQLEHYRKYAEQLDGRLKLRGRLVAIAESAEIPLWIAE